MTIRKYEPMKTMRLFILLALLGAGVVPTFAQEVDWKTFDPKKVSQEEMKRINDAIEMRLNNSLKKTAGDPREIKSWIMRGNKITTIVYNYGNITRPNTLGNVADLVWNRLGYGFEFTPLVAAEVVDTRGDIVHIMDDGMWLQTQGGYATDGSLKWGWLPKAGFAASGQADIAAWSQRSQVGGDLTRKPTPWPESWYNPVLGRYVWPSFLGNDATTPDEEVYFVCDDYTNQKYQYYPFPDDSTKRGLGLDMEVRFFQFNNPLAEDIIFLVYRITNKSPKALPKVYFGMHGDPHVGGPNDYADDRAYFIPPLGELADPYPQRARSMVYAWDGGTNVGDNGLTPGYFGFKFLESPSNSVDGIDDDDDGLIDESPSNDAGVYIDGTSIGVNTGIADTAKYRALYGAPKPRWSGDEDGDWDPLKDDVGLDGIPLTGDQGEGNGRPDIGNDVNGNLTSEPNFGIRDVHESDQIGLTSFWALPYTQSIPNVPKNDVGYWQYLSSDSISIDQELLATEGDNIFLYGSGPFALGPGETQRFSIALLMGSNLQDLLLNSETAQRVLEANYRFAQPPPKPNVTAVPGDGRVNLFWDDVAETSVDPLTGVNDFEGYKIYRSEDPTFADIYTITDANGVPFLAKPLSQNGVLAQFDLVNTWSGLHPVEYLGRGVKYQLGSNTGLVHQYVDSSVTNGKTYYYAVVSYDRGFDSLSIQLPPTESQAVIDVDAITGELTFDVNTAAVTPNPPASGFNMPTVGTRATRISGISTGAIVPKILDPYTVRDGETYTVDFVTNGGGVAYNVRPNTYVEEEFTGRDTSLVNLSRKNIIVDSVTVYTSTGAVVDPAFYFVDGEKGRIRGIVPGALAPDGLYKIRYVYNAVNRSTMLNNEDKNPVFDGVRVYVQNQTLAIDPSTSGWVSVNNTNLGALVAVPVALNPPSNPSFTPQAVDWEIRWGRTDTLPNGKWAYPLDTLINNLGRKVVQVPFKIYNMTNSLQFRGFVNNALTDSIWRVDREIVILSSANPIKTYMSVTFSAPPAGTPIVYPAEGNIFSAKTSKPFAVGDQYIFSTTGMKYEATQAADALANIYVVPNPYVATSTLEQPGRSSSLRGDQRLQFRNLPPECTIRIYTVVGELVDTIYKNDVTSAAEWDLLTYEGQRLAYGIYIYHVDVPGAGSKIGRFAVIK